MKFKEFLEYLENNLDGYGTFLRKARQFQAGQNAKRKKPWSDHDVEKVAYKMWAAAAESLYNNLRSVVKSDYPSAWVSYIKNNDVLESVNESICELDFFDEVA